MHTSSKRFLEENPTIAKRIEDCVKKLKSTFDPEKIILFGSYARGDVEDQGTMDLLIITKSKMPFFERIKKALIACKGGKPSIEPIVYTPEEFNELLSIGEGFLEDATEEGLILYRKGANGL